MFEIPNLEKKHKKISVHSEEYKVNMDINKSILDSDGGIQVFGSELFDEINSIEMRLPEQWERLPSVIKEQTKALTAEECRRLIEKKSRDSQEGFAACLSAEKGNIKNAAKLILWEAVENDDLRKKIDSELAPVSLSKISKYAAIAVLLFDDEEQAKIIAEQRLEHNWHSGSFISPGLWKDILRNHQQEMDRKSEIFQEKLLPTLKKTFYKKAVQMIDSGEFPIAKDLAKERIDGTGFQIVDELITEIDDFGGRYDSDMGLVKISSLYLSAKNIKDQLKKVFNHEMVHVLSGRSVLKGIYGEDEDEYEIEHQRIGTHFRTKKPLFRWLNEGLTEIFTKKIMNGQGYDAYEKEQELIDLIRTNGKFVIPESLFAKAYFEDLEPSQPQRERVSGWKELRRSIDEAYRPGFLIELNELIRKEGIKIILEKMKEGKI